jgi:hypothetical protein
MIISVKPGPSDPREAVKLYTYGLSWFAKTWYCAHMFEPPIKKNQEPSRRSNASCFVGTP